MVAIPPAAEAKKVLTTTAPINSQLPTAPNVTDETGKRQGEWVIYYDADWEEITDTSFVEFYRKISYVNDKPEGLVKDYYATGIKQWEGELSSDRPDVANGVSSYFYDNGNLETSGKCLENERFLLQEKILGNTIVIEKIRVESYYKNNIDKIKIIL